MSNRALVAVDDALLTSNTSSVTPRRSTDVIRPTGSASRWTGAAPRYVRRSALRQELDDTPNMPDQARRRAASRIISICEEVDRSLDVRVEAFDALRDWGNRVPQVLDGLVDSADELAARQPQPGRPVDW